MLERPPRAARRSAGRAARNRRYAERRRSGRLMLAVEVDEKLIDLMIRTGYLADRAAADRGALTRALAAMLKDAAT